MKGLELLGLSPKGVITSSTPTKVTFTVKASYQIRKLSSVFSRRSKYSITYPFTSTLDSNYEIESGLVSKLTSKYNIIAYSKATVTGKYHLGGKSTFSKDSSYSINFTNDFPITGKYAITLPFVKTLDSKYTIIGSTLLVNKQNSVLLKSGNRTINIKR